MRILMLMLFMSMATITMAEEVEVKVEVEKNKDGTNDVTTTTTVDGEVKKKIETGNVKDDEVEEVIQSDISESLEFVGMGGKGVMANENGEGDVVMGGSPGKYPPIIFRVPGDDKETPDFPEGSIVKSYDSLKDLAANYSSDLKQALGEMMR